MKSRFPLSNIAFVLLLALMPAVAAFSQETGTSSQSGTSSQQGQTPNQYQPQAPTPSVNQTGPTQEYTAPNVGSTQTATPQTGVGNTQTVAARSVGWGWLILGFLIGLLVGAVSWRRSASAAPRDETGRRVA